MKSENNVLYVSSGRKVKILKLKLRVFEFFEVNIGKHAVEFFTHKLEVRILKKISNVMYCDE